MRMDLEHAHLRLGSHIHGVLCTMHPERGPDPQPVVYAVADGHVGFLKTSMAYPTFRALATRAGGESDESYGGSLQCVPFARAASGIELKGNAAEWWYAASGVYDRGARPELGSVLNFRPTSRMRLGHVAVVTGVVNDREIEIDHANWAGAGAYKGGVARGVHVTDVSAANDWSEVQVALPDGRWGSTYPTYGFIYDRPDSGAFAGSMVAKNQAVRDAADGAEADDTEVAEAPSHPARLVHTVAARTTSVHTASAQTAASHHASRSLHVLVRHVSYTSSN